MGFRTYTCPISKRCGGCEWLAVPYPIQLRRKQEAMERLFSGLVEADGFRIGRIHGMEEPTGFRHKMASPFAPGARGRVRCGFFEAGSHRIVACQECLVEDKAGRSIINDVARIATRLRISAYQEDSARGVLRHAVVRSGYATDDVLVTLVTNGERLPQAERLVQELTELHPEITSIVQNVNERRTNAMLGRKNTTLFGTGVMHDRLLGCLFEIGPTSFYQTNPAQTELLYRLAIDAAGLQGKELLLDAYCGTGTIGICASRGCPDARVLGIEQVRGAVGCARRNAKANGLQGSCDFVCADATEHLAGSARGSLSADVVIMDPPRAGSTPQFIEAVSRLRPRSVVYVSCNPQTQLRDLREFRAHGWRTTHMELVDMFPHTKHVETVALLSKLNTEHHLDIEIGEDELSEIDFSKDATYGEIKKYVLDKYGLKVSSLYIAQIKRKHGLIERENYNFSKKENQRVPNCPEEKEKAIEDALEHFGMI